MRDLTIAEVNTLTGDDIAYWLGNPFMDADALAAKVCWWVTRAIAADRAAPTLTTNPAAAATRAELTAASGNTQPKETK